jgi:hypothetical protein
LLCQWWRLRRDPFLQWADGLDALRRTNSSIKMKMVMDSGTSIWLTRETWTLRWYQRICRACHDL